MTITAYTVTNRYGVLRAEPLDVHELSLPLRSRADLFTDPHLLVWRPAPTIAEELEPNFSIAFEVVTDRAGCRRIVPRDGYGVYFRYAWMAGLEIMRREIGNVSGEYRSSYCKMGLLLERLRNGREHFGRAFRASRDLYVRFSGRGGEIGASLLPDYVGRTADQRGRPWSIRQLTERGRQAAVADGVIDPTNDVAIPYGLTLAAELNPLFEANREKIRSLVFAALLDVGSVHVTATNEIVDDVAERVSAALHEHRDDTLGQFEAWFSGRRSNLVQTLARKSGFTPLERNVVKAALFELGKRSYAYITPCLSSFARWMAHGLELTEVERSRFSAMYLPQDCYGGLPLVLLLERNDIIGRTVAKLWEQPDDPQLVGTLHRLLAVYGELAPARRAADRRFKQLQRLIRQAAEQNNAASAAEEEIDEQNRRHLILIVDQIVRSRGDGCDQCREPTPWTISVENVGGDIVRLTAGCEEHGFEKEYELPTAEFMVLARRIAGGSSAS